MTDALAMRYKKALEELTPGGSEFVNDPEYCAEYIRSVLRMQYRHIVRLTKAVRELKIEVEP